MRRHIRSKTETRNFRAIHNNILTRLQYNKLLVAPCLKNSWRSPWIQHGIMRNAIHACLQYGLNPCLERLEFIRVWTKPECCSIGLSTSDVTSNELDFRYSVVALLWLGIVTVISDLSLVCGNAAHEGESDVKAIRDAFYSFTSPESTWRCPSSCLISIQ